MTPHRRITPVTGPARSAVFLDRDGVMNVDHGYVAQTADWQWVNGAREAVALCNRLGLWVFIVTNQSGIGRGYYTLAQMHALHDHMMADLAVAGAHVDAIYACPYYPEHMDRKPNPGMLQTAMADYPVDAARSFLIGDKDTDLMAAAAAGVTGHLFTGGDVLDFTRACLVSHGYEL
jgi:D-glycero-D-manno-heptose 1,7-bisphosphate phosphatase